MERKLDASTVATKEQGAQKTTEVALRENLKITSPNIELPMEQLAPENKPDAAAITQFYRDNGKEEKEAERLTETVVGASRGSVESQEALNAYTKSANLKANTEALDKSYGSGEIDKETHSWVKTQMAELDKKEQEARESGDFERMQKYDYAQQILLNNAKLLADTRRTEGEEAAEKLQNMLLIEIDNGVQSESSPFMEQKEKTPFGAETKPPSEHTVFMNLQLSTMYMSFCSWLKEEKGAEEENIAAIASSGASSMEQNLQYNLMVDAAENREEVESYVSEDPEERKQLLLDAGVTEQDLAYTQQIVYGAMGTAALAAGLTSLGAMFGVGEAEGEEAPGAQAAAQAQLMRDIDDLAREDQERANEAKELLDELMEKVEESGEETTVGELKDDELKERLEEMGVEQDQTIKDAIEFTNKTMETVAAQQERVDELKQNAVEGLEPSFHTDPREALEMNGIMKDGQLTGKKERIVPAVDFTSGKRAKSDKNSLFLVSPQ